MLLERNNWPSLARSARLAINSGQEDARVLLSCPAPPTLSNVCAAILSMLQLPEIATWLPCRRYHTCHFTWQAVHCICLYQAQVYIRTKSKLWSKLRMCGINIWAWLMRVPLLRLRIRKLSSHLQNHKVQNKMVDLWLHLVWILCYTLQIAAGQCQGTCSVS